ncbi:MAG: hypothetical protein SVT52_01160 [Planctomycetota bacterium]|nr:hypothetical protein [Planctomycetota bacterium]
MAKKMYYTDEEAAAKLDVTTEQLADYIRDDKLRVFQDGDRKMFQVEEVNALAGDSDEAIELAPTDEPAEPEAGDAASLAEADEAKDVGKEDTVITADGISIFDDEDLEIEAADPMAKTQIAPSLEDQIAIEGVGSGSGLLDLTRESDDTSLGEVLDHIDMEAAVGSGSGIAGEVESEPYPPPPEAVAAAQPAYVEAIDPGAGLFGGMIVGCAIVMLVMGAIVLAVMTNMVPGYLETMKQNVPLVLVGAVLLVAALGVVGLLIGKSAAGRPRGRT